MMKSTKGRFSCGCGSSCASAEPRYQQEQEPGEIRTVTSKLTFQDRLGAWKARWGVGRMHYTVDPGLYALGHPTATSPVLVSANYKMSFDHLRSRMDGLPAWILVLDTKGVNVWCAAGKGTFGTEELVRCVRDTGLKQIVEHRTLVLPQLGAPGICAHDVQRESGFRVVYGPVRAEDLPLFLLNGMRAAPDMRRVTFSFYERIVLIPVELVVWSKYVLAAALALFLLSGIDPSGYSTGLMLLRGFPAGAALISAFLAGAVAGPVFLPWLPGRAFSVKGIWIALVFCFSLWWFGSHDPSPFGSSLNLAALMILATVVITFTTLNFTGASTYTSLSGVKQEMGVSLPLQLAGIVLGLGLWLGAPFV